MSGPLLIEYRDVLTRTGPFLRARLNIQKRTTLLEIFLSRFHWREAYFKWRPNLVGEGGNRLLELAISARTYTSSPRHSRFRAGRAVVSSHQDRNAIDNRREALGMNALTVELSSEVHEMVDLMAAEKGVPPSVYCPR